MKIFDDEDEKPKTFKCCICGREEEGYGNNPSPIKKRGRCCERCNIRYVLPIKVKEILVIKKKKKN